MFGQTDNPNRIQRSTACGCVGLAVTQLAHKHSSVHTHKHTHTHNRGSVPAGGQSLPSSYTFILSFSLLPFIPPFRCHTPLHLLPLDLSFSFIPLSFSCDTPTSHPSAFLSKKKKRKKESVKDTEELANSNEKLGGRGQNHHRGQLWLGLCTCVCLCAVLFGFDSYSDVVENSPGSHYLSFTSILPLLLSSIPPSLHLFGPFLTILSIYAVTSVFIHLVHWSYSHFLCRAFVCVRGHVCVCGFRLSTWASNKGRAVG